LKPGSMQKPCHRRDECTDMKRVRRMKAEHALLSYHLFEHDFQVRFKSQEQCIVVKGEILDSPFCLPVKDFLQDQERTFSGKVGVEKRARTV